MEPVGYDADTNVYIYRDSSGSHCDTDQENLHPTLAEASSAPGSGFNGEGIPAETINHDWNMMKPFFLLMAVVLLTLLWWVDAPSSPPSPSASSSSPSSSS
jgi:hypothetical protein